LVARYFSAVNACRGGQLLLGTEVLLESVLDHHETVLPHPPPEVVSL